VYKSTFLLSTNFLHDKLIWLCVLAICVILGGTGVRVPPLFGVGVPYPPLYELPQLLDDYSRLLQRFADSLDLWKKKGQGKGNGEDREGKSIYGTPTF